MEVNLQNVVQFTNLWSYTREQSLADGVLEKSSSCGSRWHAQQTRQPGVLVLACLIDIDKRASRSRRADDGNGESREHNERGSLRHLSLRGSRVILLWTLAGGYSVRGLAKQIVISIP